MEKLAVDYDQAKIDWAGSSGNGFGQFFALALPQKERWFPGPSDGSHLVRRSHHIDSADIDGRRREFDLSFLNRFKKINRRKKE